MRFNKIQIPAYGPFTNLEIELPRTGGDFHLIYGQNEAGKSSLLRGLRGLLFGIHGQTKDTFLHLGPQLRVAAELETTEGLVRFFQRRKGTKNTLLDEAGRPLNETELRDFMDGVDEAYFDSMFGLGFEELRQGADALLRGQGRMGEALFSASLGGTPVDKVIQSLEAEAANLFRGRAKSSIRESRKSYDDCLKHAKESTIKADAWEELTNAITHKRAERDQRLKTKEECVTRRAWLERCSVALPIVGQRRECLAQLAALPIIPDLIDTFAENIKQTRMTWNSARSQIETLEFQLADLRSKATAIVQLPNILAESAEIDRLHTSFGAYRDQKENLIKLQAEAAQAKTRIEIACRELEINTPIENLSNCRISQVKFSEAEQQAASFTQASQVMASAEETQLVLKREIKRLTTDLAPANTEDITALELAIQTTKGSEEIAISLESRIAAAAVLKGKIKRLVTRLPGCLAALELIHQLAVPLKSTIEKHRENRDELERRFAELETRKSDEQRKIDHVDAEIKRLCRQRDIPSLDDLTNARSHRDHGWKLVLERWQGKENSEELSPNIPLEAAYPKAVTAADEVADRLRTEADAVAQMDEKQLQLIESEKNLLETQSLLDKLAVQKSEESSAWDMQWQPCAVIPLSPREMLEWRDHWEEFQRLWDQWSADTAKIGKDEAIIETSIAKLKSVMKDNESSLPRLFEIARTKIAEHHQLVGAERALRNQLNLKEKTYQSAATRIPDLQKDLDHAQTAWQSCKAKFSLPDSLPADSVMRLLNARKSLFIEYDHWCNLLDQCNQLSERISIYEATLAQVMSKLKFESHGAENDETTLKKALDEAQSSANRAQTIHGQIQDRETDLTNIQQSTDQARALFDSMLQSAHLEGDENLDEFLHHFESKNALHSRIGTLRESLAASARTENVDDFIKRVEAENSDGLEGNVVSISSQIDGLDAEVEILRSGLQELNNRQKLLEAASDESARQIQLSELALADLQNDSERFIRLHLAITLLKGRIDQFRQENQGPFMEKASRWFRELTGSAFSGISTQFDAGDQPIIAGQRSHDAPDRDVAINSMSEGTRDQLFLALRLAGLELHLADHEPMPLILDDLLVHFDDVRSQHALAALRTFGQSSQIILFTHHAHLVELAKNAFGSHGLHIHQMNARFSSPQIPDQRLVHL